MKETFYQNSIEEKLDYIPEYQPSNGRLLKKTFYRFNGKTIDFIREYDLLTGAVIKVIKYLRDEDGKTIDFIREYDTSNGKNIKVIRFLPNGKAITFIKEYDPSNGKKIKATYYKHDGEISLTKKYDAYTGALIQEKSI